MMQIHALHGAPSPLLADALAAFEAQFDYPLGPIRSFRISHGADYPRFFRAMGDARCFVAEADGRVLGTVGVALREVTLPNGTRQWAAYIGDVKIAPLARGGVVLHRLSRAADAWARPQVTCAFGVVMHGTSALPDAYTGRAGVPGFEKIGTLSIRRLPSNADTPDDSLTLAANEGRALYEALSRGCAFASGGEPEIRSEATPKWIVAPDGQACGRLEDTRRAKRLLVDDGTELSSAHLACFAWRTPAAAAIVINAARRRAARIGLPAVFVAIDANDVASMDAVAGGPSVTIAGATVYGVNLPADSRWSLSSSEV